MKPAHRRPPLGALATFEVAAKHLSFTLAAKELNITQGAVSQQIRLLELALGTQLFLRKHNALELTPAGGGLFGAVAAGLDRIRDGVDILRPDGGSRTITIAATDGLATFWLKPLIDSFRIDHPEVSFVVLASDEDPGLGNYSEVDIALLCGNERCEVGEILHFMYPEVAQPVCAPAYLAKHGPFPDAESLNRTNLLHLHERHWSSEAIRWHPLGWEEWFQAQGARWRREACGFATNKVPLLIEAALAGEGVMLGIHNLVRRYVESGALVYAHPASINAGRGNFLKCHAAAMRRPIVARFVEHLLQDLRR